MAQLDYRYETKQGIPWTAVDSEDEDSFEEFIILTDVGSFSLTEQDLEGMIELLRTRRRYKSN